MSSAAIQKINAKVDENFRNINYGIRRPETDKQKPPVIDFLRALLKCENFALLEDYTYTSIEAHLPKFLNLRLKTVPGLTGNGQPAVAVPVEMRRFLGYFLEQVAHFKHKMSLRCIPACMELFNDGDPLVCKVALQAGRALHSR